VAWVSEIGEEVANPVLRSVYDQVRACTGEIAVPEYFRVQGLAPSAIHGQLVMDECLMKDGALNACQKQQLLVVVSGINTSSYCVAFHMDILRRMGMERSLARKLATDYEGAAVEPNVKSLFRLAEQLTRNPSTVAQNHVDAVCAAGWSEAALLETVLTTAWANFYNRVSLGLGLMADF
jgi:uncharacterized peroxidase-related enzyme